MLAEQLDSLEELENVESGLYIVQSGTEAYFPAIARIEEGSAQFVGELYTEEGT